MKYFAFAMMIIFVFVISYFMAGYAVSRYKPDEPAYMRQQDIMCGIHTQQGANYYILGEATKKKDGWHLLFYPNGDKRIDEQGRKDEIFAIEVILPGGVLWAK